MASPPRYIHPIRHTPDKAFTLTSRATPPAGTPQKAYPKKHTEKQTQNHLVLQTYLLERVDLVGAVLSPEAVGSYMPSCRPSAADTPTPANNVHLLYHRDPLIAYLWKF